MTGQLDLAILTEGAPILGLSTLELAVSPFYVLFRQAENISHLKALTLKNLHGKVWIMFGRHVHTELYEKVMRTAGENGAIPSSIHHATCAEEAAQLLSQVGGVAFLTRNGAWRVLAEELTMRPLEKNGLRLRTVLALDQQ